jgi:hypothetical protein
MPVSVSFKLRFSTWCHDCAYMALMFTRNLTWANSGVKGGGGRDCNEISTVHIVYYLNFAITRLYVFHLL